MTQSLAVIPAKLQPRPLEIRTHLRAGNQCLTDCLARTGKGEAWCENACEISPDTCKNSCNIIWGTSTLNGAARKRCRRDCGS